MESTPDTIAAIIQGHLKSGRIPRATYRIQFSPTFGFSDLLDLVSYLDELGISDCYVSPIFRARTGSSHGYDVCDHNQISPVLGGEEAFEKLAAALREREMSIILDIVPNHMGIGDVANTWWMDVLENGPSSLYASYFDIDWKPVKPELAHKVLLPVLGDQYGRVLERGELRLVYNGEAFMLCYYEHRFPVVLETYFFILSHKLETLSQLLETQPEYLQEYQSILTAIGYLPSYTDSDPERRIERNREKEVIKRRLATLYQESDVVRRIIDETIEEFNGVVGEPRSFDLLDTLISNQVYRLAYWRVAAEEINYRRFFDVNDLAAIRMEEPAVFHATHQLVFRLLTEKKICGLRIDHIDGLYDPEAYLRQIQEEYLFHTVLAQLDTLPPNGQSIDSESIRPMVQEAIVRWQTSHPSTPPWPVYVVAEKILSAGETLPRTWALHGTTGYDFLTVVNGLFVDANQRDKFDALYHRFIGMVRPFSELVNASKKMIMLVSMDSEIYALSHQLERIAERNRRYRDFTLNTLTFAIREVIACLPVYRTYTRDRQTILERDRQYIEAAVSEAKRRNPRTASEVFDFLRDLLLLDNLENFRPEDQQPIVQWVRKFQQLTGPVMAKGVEDTAFYVYNRLVSLNEVGGNPENFGISIDAFHQHNLHNQTWWPHTMLCSSTHDTKRSEDVRARISVLSEIPQWWEEALHRWSKMNEDKKQTVETFLAPSRNDEYLLYQVLIGAWPIGSAEEESPKSFPVPLLSPTDAVAWNDFRQRIIAYMRKATKEAKVHTSWVQPHRPYDTAVESFVSRILSDDPRDPFVEDIRECTRMVAYYGQFTSLSQTLLKLTAPGVPDFYQGNELWDFSLVDPDNRRPVDYSRRRALLKELTTRLAHSGPQIELARELLATSFDGRIKLYLTVRLLQFRREHPQVFARSTYLPLKVREGHDAYACCFARTADEQRMVVVAPRMAATLSGLKPLPPMGISVWGKSKLILPDDDADRWYRHILTGEVYQVARSQEGEPMLLLADVLANFPVAALERIA